MLISLVYTETNLALRPEGLWLIELIVALWLGSLSVKHLDKTSATNTTTATTAVPAIPLILL